MKDATATAMSHMAIGTGSTAAAAGDSALGNEAGRVSLTSTTLTESYGVRAASSIVFL